VTRVISSLVVLAIVGGAVWAAPWWVTLALAALVAALAGIELARLSQASGATVPATLTACSAVAACASVPVSMDNGAVMVGVLSAILVAGGVAALAGGPPAPARLSAAAGALMAPVYVGLPLGALAWVCLAYGPRPLTFAIAVIVASDSAQYFVGRAVGRRPLAPFISPAKTIEGALGGLVAAGLVGVVLGPRWGQVGSMLTGAGVGVGLSCLGIAGDLFESLLKRSAGVKDSSALIPGHGGILDRIDAYLFAIPAYVLFLRYAG